MVSGDKSSGKTHLLQGCTFAAMDKAMLHSDNIGYNFVVTKNSTSTICKAVLSFDNRIFFPYNLVIFHADK
jgi:chromosomal replication initiation ATPase DnaA